MVIHIIRNMLIELRLLAVVGVQCMVGHLSCVCLCVTVRDCATLYKSHITMTCVSRRCCCTRSTRSLTHSTHSRTSSGDRSIQPRYDLLQPISQSTVNSPKHHEHTMCATPTITRTQQTNEQTNTTNKKRFRLFSPTRQAH